MIVQIYVRYFLVESLSRVNRWMRSNNAAAGQFALPAQQVAHADEESLQSNSKCSAQKQVDPRMCFDVSYDDDGDILYYLIACEGYASTPQKTIITRKCLRNQQSRIGAHITRFWCHEETSPRNAVPHLRPWCNQRQHRASLSSRNTRGCEACNASEEKRSPNLQRKMICETLTSIAFIFH